MVQTHTPGAGFGTSIEQVVDLAVPQFGAPIPWNPAANCRADFRDSSSACLQPIWACLKLLESQVRSSERMLNKSSMFQVIIFLKVVKVTPQEQVCSAPQSTFPAPVCTFPSSSGLVRFPACPGPPSHNPRGFHAECSSNGSCRSCRALRSFELRSSNSSAELLDHLIANGPVRVLRLRLLWSVRP